MNTVEIPYEYSVPILTKIGPNIRNYIKQYISDNYLNKTVGTMYILKVDLSPLDKELPLYDIDKYKYNIILHTTLFYTNNGDIHEAKLIIDKDNDKTVVRAYSNYISCNIILNYGMQINEDEGYIYILDTKKYIRRDDSINIRITNIYASYHIPQDRILCDGEICLDDTT